MGSIVGIILALCKGGPCRNPSGISTHYFDDGNQIVLTHRFVVEGRFLHHRAKVFNDASVARAVVGGNQVVINGLGHSNYPQGIALALGKFRNFIGCILGVISSAVKEVADIVGFKNFEDTLILLVALKFKAAGTQSRSWGVAQATNVLLGLFGEINQVFFKNAKHSIHTPVDFLDALLIERFRDNPGYTGVNDGSRPARLGDQAISN